MKLVDDSNLTKGSEEASADIMVGKLVSEMLNASTLTHKLHLAVTGTGSYAQHVALGEFYSGIKDLADDLAEQYQGHKLILLETEEAPMVNAVVKTNEDALKYLDTLYMFVSKTQSMMTCSSIISQMDDIKSLINSTKYKLHFLS